MNKVWTKLKNCDEASGNLLVMASEDLSGMITKKLKKEKGGLIK